VSSVLWFKQAKASLALTDYLDRMLLFAPEAMHGSSLLSLIEQIPVEEIRREGRSLVSAYRAATTAREYGRKRK